MITVIDSGVANLESVMGALRRLGMNAEVTSEAEKILSSSHVILPGVGAASAAMAQLRKKGLIELIPQLKQPFLGICLGMQLLYDYSNEGDGTECLSVIPGSIKHLKASAETPVPHMGWNDLVFLKSEHPLLQGIKNKSYVYFVHSYAAMPTSTSIALTKYGTEFTSIVAYKNFFGCQFHPERSGQVGGLILKNFLDM